MIRMRTSTGISANPIEVLLFLTTFCGQGQHFFTEDFKVFLNEICENLCRVLNVPDPERVYFCRSYSHIGAWGSVQ